MSEVEIETLVTRVNDKLSSTSLGGPTTKNLVIKFYI